MEFRVTCQYESVARWYAISAAIRNSRWRLTTKRFCSSISARRMDLPQKLHEIALAAEALFNLQDISDMFSPAAQLRHPPDAVAMIALATREHFRTCKLAQGVDVEAGSVPGCQRFGCRNGSVSIRCSASSSVTEECKRQYCPVSLRHMTSNRMSAICSSM